VKSVEITVRDNGHGIPADVLPRIFDPFFTTKEVGQGVGLGLFIVFEIIEEHGGCIAVDSETGRGTTFRIRLPLEKP
jgi:signal transduction histidine kinase